MFYNQVSNNNNCNNNSNSFLVLLLLLLASRMMLMGFELVESRSSSCGCILGSSNSTTNTNNTTTSVQSYWKVLDREIIELTCHQNRLSDALSLLKINSTINAEIISMRTKHIDKITKAIGLLTQERSFLEVTTRTVVTKNVSIISNNGQESTILKNIAIISNGAAFEYNDGTRAKSCRDYRNPIQGYQYNNEGSGLYNIEPSNGLILTVYCDMITDGGGWTLISGIRNDYGGIHFHTFEDSTAISTPTIFTSFHIKTAALLTISTQVRAATDTTANPVTTFYQSNWPYSAYCTITQAFRDAIQTVQTNPQHVSGDLPASCAVLTGSFSAVPTHFTYGKTSNGYSTGFRMGFPHAVVSGHLSDGSYATYSFNIHQGVYHTFAVGEYNRNGAVFLR